MKASKSSRKKYGRNAPVRRKAALSAAATSIPPVQAQTTGTPSFSDIEHLMDEMREANGHLILAAIGAQYSSDDAAAETATARSKLAETMQQIWSKNEQLVAAASEARAMKDAAAQREEAYRQLSGRLLHLQDEERRRLALDLHDSTGQLLAALIMNLGFIERAAGLGARSRKALSESRSLAERCSREVRTLTYLLYPPLLDEAGLLSAVRWYVAGFEKRSGIHVHVHLDEIGRLPSPVERSFFRVVQESLTNVHRHASTTTASIRLTRASSLVVLEVSDTGRGLEGASAKPVGVGIIGMRERVRQVGGTFDVTFSETGTTVRATVPEGPP